MPSMVVTLNALVRASDGGPTSPGLIAPSKALRPMTGQAQTLDALVDQCQSCDISYCANVKHYTREALIVRVSLRGYLVFSGIWWIIVDLGSSRDARTVSFSLPETLNNER
jgi:hypothetical protein